MSIRNVEVISVEEIDTRDTYFELVAAAKERRRWRAFNAVAWAASVIVVGTYLLGSPHQFDVANAACFVPTAMPAFLRRAWPPVALSSAFGVFGILHLLGVSV